MIQGNSCSAAEAGPSPAPEGAGEDRGRGGDRRGPEDGGDPSAEARGPRGGGVTGVAVGGGGGGGGDEDGDSGEDGGDAGSDGGVVGVPKMAARSWPAWACCICRSSMRSCQARVPTRGADAGSGASARRWPVLVGEGDAAEVLRVPEVPAPSGPEAGSWL